MVSDSVWLGSGRSTVFKLAKLVSGITVLVWAGMVINRLFFGGNGMYELLRPEGGIMATLIKSIKDGFLHRFGNTNASITNSKATIYEVVIQ